MEGQILYDAFSDGLHEYSNKQATSVDNRGKPCYFTHEDEDLRDRIVCAKEWPYYLSIEESPHYNDDYPPSSQVTNKPLFDNPVRYIGIGSSQPHFFQFPLLPASNPGGKTYGDETVQLDENHLYRIFVRAFFTGQESNVYDDTFDTTPVWRWWVKVKYKVYMGLYSRRDNDGSNETVYSYWTRYGNSFAAVRQAFSTWNFVETDYTAQEHPECVNYWEETTMFTAEARKGYGTEIDFRPPESQQWADQHLQGRNGSLTNQGRITIGIQTGGQ